MEIAPYPSSLRGRRLEPASQALVKFHERLAARLDSEIALAPVEQDLLDFLNGIRLSPSMMAQACRQNATMRAPLGLDTVGRAPPPIPDALSFALYCNALLSICAPEADQMNTNPPVQLTANFSISTREQSPHPAQGLFSYKRAGAGCLDSAPRDLSGFLPGYAERGALRFCRCVGRA
ncbi:hypothetical protein [Bradyrhizobium sp. 2S1]|uniref:hypothetical protein n=1 Tax=Bradyrhizobium sp. 2S1 TaxID=1404429 RepID=UPI00140E6FF9|nr:hypothetical protein [Bradyrhizobium sp. 2S1]MCK7664443.1 hypothetical protein [Bradyrhizobium sp. 2S1]